MILAKAGRASVFSAIRFYMFILRIRHFASIILAIGLLTSQVFSSVPSQCGCCKNGCSARESGFNPVANSTPEMITRTGCCSPAARVAENHCNCEQRCDQGEESPHSNALPDCDCGLTPTKIPAQDDLISCQLKQFRSGTPDKSDDFVKVREYDLNPNALTAPPPRESVSLHVLLCIWRI